MSKLSTLVLTKVFLSLCGVLAIICLGLFLFLRFWQTRLIFFPSPVIAAIPADVKLSYEEVWLPVATGKIQCWWIPSAKAEDPVLLYLHGNSSNIGDTVGRALQFHHLASVLLIDYRGYGRSSGTFPSEASVYEDAEAAWIYLTKTRQIAPKEIVSYGHSLGGAIAIQLAVQHPEMAGVIVEGTFTSVRAMLDYLIPYQFPMDWIVTQRFDSLAKVRSLQTPILFIHGTADQTVPAQMSRDLFAAAPEPKQLLLVPNAGHNNTPSLVGTQYLQVIQDFLQKAPVKD